MRVLATRVLSSAWSRASRCAGWLAADPIRLGGVTVVSVGALAAGGAGRTPLAMHVAATLRDRGHAVALVLRGYRGTRSRSGALVSDGSVLSAGAREAGDEAILAARRVRGVLVRVGADRVEAARRARADGARVVVLDDGFQHRRLHREMDLVALDADADPGRDGLVYREGTEALERATLVALRDATRRPEDDRAFGWTLVPDVLVDAELAPVGSMADLAGRRVIAACAIARPARLGATLAALGARVVASVSARDHAPVAARAAAALSRNPAAEIVVATEKDLVREPEAWRRLPAVALRMCVRLGPCAERLTKALDRVG